MAEGTFWKLTPEFCQRDTVKALAEALNEPIAAAACYTALLYAWGVKNAGNDGNINACSERVIERACVWTGPREKLIQAFHDSGIICGDLEDRSEDDPLFISDWENVAADVLAQRKTWRENAHKRRNSQKDVSVDVSKDVSVDVSKDVSEEAPLYKNIRTLELEKKRGDRKEEPRAYKLEAYASSLGIQANKLETKNMLAMRQHLSDDAIMYALDEAVSRGRTDMNYALGIMRNYVNIQPPMDVSISAHRKNWIYYEDFDDCPF